MPTDLGERRRAARRVPSPVEALSRLRLRAGRELAVIDISSNGALVESTTRLLPGTHVDVHVTAAHGRILVRARVVRCAVWMVTPQVVQYRGALAFTSPVDLPSLAATSLGRSRSLDGRDGDE
jgi:PilZ domain-containing protein